MASYCLHWLSKSHHTTNPYGVATKVEKSGEGYRVTGSKKFVLDGHVANKIVVVGRSSGSTGDRDGLSLVLVDREASGVNVTRTIMADSRNAANIEFEGAPGILLGSEGNRCRCPRQGIGCGSNCSIGRNVG